MKNLILVLLALLILGGGAYLVYNKMFKTNFIETNNTSTQQRTEIQITAPTTNQSSVTIENFTYTPSNIKVKVGETITWTNKDSMRHDAAADDGSWKVELMGQGESQQIKFEKPGTYTYHCSPHPWMKGTIVVE